MKLPPSLAQEWFNRSYYGTVNHNSKAVYQRYLGWFDGNPAHLYTYPPSEGGKRYVEYMGGPDALLQKAKKSFAEGDYRFVAEVVSLGSRHDLAAARREYPNLVFQGNVAEEVLRTGTQEAVSAAVRACVTAGGGTRHIVNLNHGVDKSTPVANFEAYVRAAKEC